MFIGMCTTLPEETNKGDTSETRARDPRVTSRARYHCATRAALTIRNKSTRDTKTRSVSFAIDVRADIFSVEARNDWTFQETTEHFILVAFSSGHFRSRGMELKNKLKNRNVSMREWSLSGRPNPEMRHPRKHEPAHRRTIIHGGSRG